MPIQVKVISKKLHCGEGPHWDENSKCLYFVDIPGSTINKYDPKTDLHTQAKVGDAEVSLIIPVKNETGKFLITSGCSIATVVWDGISETVSDFKILQTLDEDTAIRINDGKVSPSGSLLVGTMKREIDFNNLKNGAGSIYSFKDFKVKKLLSGTSISNGMAWSHDENTFYFLDSARPEVLSYQYNKETTEITNEKTVFDFKENSISGFPDGMTIDADGNLWIACYDGAKVINIDPVTGKLLRTIDLPARFITSVAFGGPNFEDLYVTSSREGPNEHLSSDKDGCTFRITGTGAQGLPAAAIQL